MILVDANLLIYASIGEFPQHRAAKDWLDGQLNGSDRVGMPWSALLAFVRIVANPRFFKEPETILTAWRQVEGWLDIENVWIPEPTQRHRMVLTELLKQAGGNPNQVPDAHLAALAIEHDLTLYSGDRGFARYSALRWVNPLQPTT
jgi:toxin-antitoxin system PIN domain toxin